MNHASKNRENRKKLAGAHHITTISIYFVSPSDRLHIIWGIILRIDTKNMEFGRLMSLQRNYLYFAQNF